MRLIEGSASMRTCPGCKRYVDESYNRIQLERVTTVWMVKCKRTYCKFKGTFPDRRAANEAAEEHRTGTARKPAGSHDVEMKEKGSPGSRSPIARRRVRR